MIAVWLAVAEAATARGISSGGTRLGTSACRVGVSKARAVPTTSRMRKNASRPSQPRALPSASAMAQTALTTWQARAMARRS
jgi:hypothetical protein